MWVRTCVVLHTLIGWIEDGVEDLTFLDENNEDLQRDFSLTEDPLPPSQNDDMELETPGWEFRRRLRDHAVRQGLI